MITTIIKLKSKDKILFDEETGEVFKIEPSLYTLQEVAQEVWEVFGKGGNPSAPIIEEYVGYVNSPVGNGYCRAAFDPAFTTALQYIQEIDGAESCEVISVETDGQEMYQVGTIVDQDGVEQPEYLGLIAGVDMKTINTFEDI